MTDLIKDVRKTVPKWNYVINKKGVRLENIGPKHPKHSYHSQGHKFKGVYTDVLVYENRSDALIAHFIGPYAKQLAREVSKFFDNTQGYL